MSGPIHRLTALIAVERDAANEYRKAVEHRRTVVLTSGTKCDEYTAAEAAGDEAMRAMMSARVEVDTALAALSYPRDGVVPLA